ncbi:MAG: ferritin family protein [Spirochaetia bacterium]|nr:ferritin family protein [Spirochaetia bacterium]
MPPFVPVNKTGFLETVNACINHEERVHQFYLRHAESLPAGEIKKLFSMLAGDVNEHIKLIEHIREDVLKNNAQPNLKMAADVQSFQNTSLYKLMRRLDRNTDQHVGEDEQEALVLAAREHADNSEFYGKMIKRFKDPSIQLLFKTLSNFQDENRLMIQSYLALFPQGSQNIGKDYYWDDDQIHEEVQKTPDTAGRRPEKDVVRAKLKKGKSNLRKSS